METLADLRNIRPGNFVCLSDEETIADLMERKIPNAMDGLQLEVDRVYHIREKDGMCDWYLCTLKGEPEGYTKLFFFVKIVDDEFDKRVYWVPDDMTNPKTRGDLINDDIVWLFKEPDNKYGIIPSELDWTSSIELTPDATKPDSFVEYEVKGGPLHGECRQTPAPQGLVQPQFATVVEWSTGDPDAQDVEILVLEIGGLDEEGDPVDEGGVVYYFQGGPVNDNDISLIQQ